MRTTKLRKWLVWSPCIVVALYMAMLTLFWMNQRSIVFSGAYRQGRPEIQMDDLPGVERVELRAADGSLICAAFGAALTEDGKPHPNAASCPTLLFFYGNGACLKHTWRHLQHLRHLGVNLMIPEYLGYGMSEGQPSEAGCYATADAAYAHLLARKDIDPKRIIACGWSLGSGVAVDLAAREPVAGLAVFSAYTSVHECGQQRFPFLPVSLLLKDRFESEHKMPHVKCPVFLAHGANDKNIPCDMSRRLAAVARTPTTLVVVPDAGHNDIFKKGNGGLLYKLQVFAESASDAP